MTAEELAGQLGGKRSGPGQWTARCPAHEDSTPSLSIADGRNGAPVVHCHAGCSQDDVIAALRSRGLWPSSGESRPDLPAGVLPSLDGLDCSSSWRYRGADGQTLGHVARYDGRGGKELRPYFKREGSEWRMGAAELPRPLYGLDRLADRPDAPVIVCEGEKAADAAERLSPAVVAVTSPGGSSSAGRADWSPLKGRRVAVWPDHDKAGQEYARDVAEHLERPGARLAGVVDCEALWAGEEPKGQDAADLDKIPDGGLPMVAAEATADGNDREAVIRSLSDVAPEAVTWLWEPYIPAGKLTIVEGNPGDGKTWAMLAIAATVSSGGQLPGSATGCEPGNVLYLTFEDGLADTLRPRLDDLGADVSRIHALTGWREGGEDMGPLTAAEVDLLAGAIDQLQPGLVVVDPIQAYIGAGVDMHRANETRPILARLAQIAEATGAAVVVIRHLRKSGTSRAIQRGLGSIDFAAAARSILLIGQDPEADQDRNPPRVLVHHKSSVALKGESLSFSLTGGVFGWAGVSELTAEDVLEAPKTRDQRTAVDEAADFLSAELDDGPRPVSELKTEAESLGHGWRTVQRAKDRLGVEARRVGGAASDGRWEWSLRMPTASKSGDLASLEEANESKAKVPNPTPKAAKSVPMAALGDSEPESESESDSWEDVL